MNWRIGPIVAAVLVTTFLAVTIRRPVKWTRTGPFQLDSRNNHAGHYISNVGQEPHSHYLQNRGVYSLPDRVQAPQNARQDVLRQHPVVAASRLNMLRSPPFLRETETDCGCTLSFNLVCCAIGSSRVVVLNKCDCACRKGTVTTDALIGEGCSLGCPLIYDPVCCSEESGIFTSVNACLCSNSHGFVIHGSPCSNQYSSVLG